MNAQGGRANPRYGTEKCKRWAHRVRITCSYADACPQTLTPSKSITTKPTTPYPQAQQGDKGAAHGCGGAEGERRRLANDAMSPTFVQKPREERAGETNTELGPRARGTQVSSVWE